MRFLVVRVGQLNQLLLVVIFCVCLLRTVCPCLFACALLRSALRFASHNTIQTHITHTQTLVAEYGQWASRVFSSSSGHSQQHSQQSQASPPSTSSSSTPPDSPLPHKSHKHSSSQAPTQPSSHAPPPHAQPSHAPDSTTHQPSSHAPQTQHSTHSSPHSNHSSRSSPHAVPSIPSTPAQPPSVLPPSRIPQIKQQQAHSSSPQIKHQQQTHSDKDRFKRTPPQPQPAPHPDPDHTRQQIESYLAQASPPSTTAAPTHPSLGHSSLPFSFGFDLHDEGLPPADVYPPPLRSDSPVPDLYAMGSESPEPHAADHTHSIRAPAAEDTARQASTSVAENTADVSSSSSGLVSDQQEGPAVDDSRVQGQQQGSSGVQGDERAERRRTTSPDADQLFNELFGLGKGSGSAAGASDETSTDDSTFLL